MDRQLLPVIALRETVIFPGLTVPLGVGRPASIKALEAARKQSGMVFCVAQRENADNPTFEQLYTIGTIARIVRVSPGPGGLSVLLSGEHRGTAIQFREREGVAEAFVVPVEDMRPLDSEDPAFVGLFRELRDRAYELGALRGVPEPSLREALDSAKEPGAFADRVSGYMELPSAEKQMLLETLGVEERMRRLLIYVQRQIGVVKAQQEIQSKVQEKLGERQREVYLREQLKAIKKELGDDSKENDIEELEQRLPTSPCQRRCARRSSASSVAWSVSAGKAWRRKSSVPTSKASRSCRGTRAARTRSISSAPRKCWKRTTTAWKT